jgi:peptidoglycan/LPS O-acetylase OafA/YrhL
VQLKRLSQLDGIRGLAVVVVVFHHMSSILNADTGRKLFLIALIRILHTGWLGVDIFFVLSGFLITSIILKDRSNPDFWGAFYSRRGFRILPAFIAVFVITLVSAHFFSPAVQGSSGYILAAAFFMANWTVVTDSEMPMFNHLWSLAVEEQFYFLWPQAAKRMKTGTILKLALSLAVASELLRLTLAILHVNTYIVYKITPTRIDGLSIGAALAVGITLPPVNRFLAVWWRRIALVAAALLPLAFLACRGSLFVFNVWSQVLAIPPAIVLTAIDRKSTRLNSSHW